MGQLSLAMETLPDKPERSDLKTRIVEALADLEEREILASGEAHARGLRHANPYKEGLHEGARQAFKKAAQMTREVIREFRPRVRDAVSRR